LTVHPKQILNTMKIDSIGYINCVSFNSYKEDDSRIAN